jgi:hypothetical protein
LVGPFRIAGLDQEVYFLAHVVRRAPEKKMRFDHTLKSPFARSQHPVRGRILASSSSNLIRKDRVVNIQQRIADTREAVCLSPARPVAICLDPLRAGGGRLGQWEVEKRDRLVFMAATALGHDLASLGEVNPFDRYGNAEYLRLKRK